MLHPSYTDLMSAINSEADNSEQTTVNSRYLVVIATSRRARQLIDEKVSQNETGNLCFKPLSMAVNELYSGDVKILTEEEIEQAEEDVAQTLQEKQSIAQQKAHEFGYEKQVFMKGQDWLDESDAEDAMMEE